MTESEGTVEFSGFQTWYRVTGRLDPSDPQAPIVLLHGGPGATHDYLDAMRGLAAGGRAVVQYDQLGNGRSTHLRDRGPDFWTVELFCEELDNLLAALGVAGRYHLLGRSWGGCLALEHALRTILNQDDFDMIGATFKEALACQASQHVSEGAGTPGDVHNNG